MNGVEKAIKQAGTLKALGNLIGTSPEFVFKSAKKGYLPLERARIASDTYGIPLVELVRPDIRRAILSTQA